MPYPLPLTRTEAYLAYKAGVIQQSDLKPSLAVPRNGIDEWLAYWTGLAEDYPKREDGTPHILQEEEAYIAYLCGVINEYPEKCLRRVGAYLRYLISARWGRPDHPLNREELYLSLLKTQVIPSGDPSSDIEIDGTAKAPFQDVKMYGDTFQQSYSGKNLYNFEPNTAALNGLSVTYDNDTGLIHVSGTPTANWANIGQAVSDNLPAGNYILWVDNPNPNYRINLRTVQGGANNDYHSSDGGSSVAFTTANDSSSMYIYIDHNYGLVAIDWSFKLMLESGSTATSFEPFVGGQPSPSPDYPQPIQTVTGEQTVSINGTNYPISLGSLELCKLGTYQDYIYKDGDDWKVHKATNKITVDGSENWVYPDSGANYTFFQFSRNNFRSKYGNAADFYASNTGVGFAKADKFEQIVASSANMRTKQGIGFTTEGNGWFRISVANTIATTTEAFKTWLSNHPTTTYYALAAATDTVITNQALINQLEALVAGGAENGTTYIKVNATEPNLPGLLYVEAPKYE